MKYKLVMFDLDGTTLNTIADLANCMNYILKLHNMPTHSLQTIEQFLGNGIKKLVELSVGDQASKEEIEIIYNEFLKYYGEHALDETKPYNGIENLLMTLKQKGYILVLISNKADFVVQKLVLKFFNGIFDYATGEKLGIRKKPYPDSVNVVLKMFNIKNSEAIYIGDTEVDSQTAVNANIDSIIVSWGFREKSELENLKKTYFVDYPSQIIEILEKNN